MSHLGNFEVTLRLYTWKRVKTFRAVCTLSKENYNRNTSKSWHAKKAVWPRRHLRSDEDVTDFGFSLKQTKKKKQTQNKAKGKTSSFALDARGNARRGKKIGRRRHRKKSASRRPGGSGRDPLRRFPVTFRPHSPVVAIRTTERPARPSRDVRLGHATTSSGSSAPAPPRVRPRRAALLSTVPLASGSPFGPIATTFTADDVTSRRRRRRYHKTNSRTRARRHKRNSG